MSAPRHLKDLLKNPRATDVLRLWARRNGVPEAVPVLVPPPVDLETGDWHRVRPW